jgi:hypothetical protein
VKKYVEETLERKRSHIKYVPALSSLERDQRPGAPRRAQLDPGTILSPFKYWGLFYCSHFEKSLEYAVQRIFGGLGKNTHFPGVSENHPQLQLL